MYRLLATCGRFGAEDESNMSWQRNSHEPESCKPCALSISDVARFLLLTKVVFCIVFRALLSIVFAYPLQGARCHLAMESPKR